MRYLLLLILAGCASKPVENCLHIHGEGSVVFTYCGKNVECVKIGDETRNGNLCRYREQAVKPKVEPKLKVGDCITLYGSPHGYVIKQVMDRDYGLIMGLECSPEDDIQKGCSSTAYPIETVDENSEIIECPYTARNKNAI